MSESHREKLLSFRHAARQRRVRRPMRPVPRLETLEPRLLLAADFTGAFPLDAGTSSPSGQHIQLDFDLSNIGDEAAKGSVEVDLYASTDLAFDAEGDTFLGRFKLKGKLDIEQTATTNLKVNLPASLPAGNVHLIAVLDPDNKLGDENGDNNTIVSENTLEITQPDYDLTAAFGAAKFSNAIVAGQGSKGSVQVLVTNNGTANVAKGVKVEVQVFARPEGAVDDSQDVLLNAKATAVTVGNMKPGAVKKGNVSLLFGADLPEGEYEIVVVVDTANALAETNENNNEATLADTVVTVADPFTDFAVEIDLAKLKLPGDDVVSGDGTKFKLPVKVSNLGNVAFDKTTTVDIAVFAAPIGGGDEVEVFVAEDVKIGALKAGATKTINLSFTLPPGVTDGNYQFRAVLTPGDPAADANEDNNEGATGEENAIGVQEGFVDLVTEIDSMGLPAAVVAGSGAKGKITLIITNAGNVPLPKGQNVVIQVALRPVFEAGSIGAATEEGDTVVGTFNTSLSGLQDGKAKKINLTVEIDGTVAEGTYQPVVYVTPNPDLVEPDAENNNAEFDGAIQVAQPFIDVRINSVAPILVGQQTAGSSEKFEVILENIGNDPVDGTSTVEIFATTNGTIDGNAILVGRTLNAKTNLAPGKTAKVKVDGVMPDVANATQFMFVARVTANNYTDGDAANNTSSAGTATVTPVQSLLQEFGSTLTFTETTNTNVAGQTAMSGTFVSANGRTGIFSANTLPVLNKTMVFTISMQDPNFGGQYTATMQIHFSGSRPTSLQGLTIRFDEKVSGKSGTMTFVNLVSSFSGALLANGKGEFKVL